MTDVDGDMTPARRSSAGANGCGDDVETMTLDWGRKESWPDGEFDVVIAADVLYDGDAAAAVAAVAEMPRRGGSGSM